MVCLILPSVDILPPPLRPIIRLEREREHQHYYLKNGEEVAGCSSISKMGDDPGGLIHWAWKQGMEGIDYRSARDRAANAGTITHFMADCYLAGAEPDLREFSKAEIDLAWPSFEKFLDFWAKEKLTMVSHEEQLVHEDLRYGGTLDLRALDDEGRHVLLDYKTNKAKVFDSNRRQLAGYELLSNFNHPDQIIQRRAIIRLGRDKDDCFHAHWIVDSKAETNIRIFKAQAFLYNEIADSKYKRNAPLLLPDSSRQVPAKAQEG